MEDTLRDMAEHYAAAKCERGSEMFYKMVDAFLQGHRQGYEDGWYDNDEERPSEYW